MESAIPASSGIEVKDDLLASARVDPAMLLPNFPPAPRNLQADASTAALDHISSAMHVPMRLYHALQASLSSAQAPRPRSLGPSRAREVPTKRSVEGYGEHADHFKADELGQRQLVGGRVGVLYLAGGGRMVFTEQDTQEVSRRLAAKDTHTVSSNFRVRTTYSHMLHASVCGPRQ
jgi:hypothetical protein